MDVPAGGEVLRLQGHVYRVNALFDQAEIRYRQALDLACQTANAAAEGKTLTDLLQTLSWCRPADALDLQPRAVDTNQAVRNQVELVKVHAATAVAMANLGNADKASTQIQAGLELTRQCGYPGGVVWHQAADAFNQLKQGDEETARRTAASLGLLPDLAAQVPQLDVLLFQEGRESDRRGQKHRFQAESMLAPLGLDRSFLTRSTRGTLHELVFIRSARLRPLAHYTPDLPDVFHDQIGAVELVA